MNSEGTSEFIEIYRESACLWDSSCALYVNRNARKSAQQQLLNIMLRYEATSNIASVRKKIDTLRSMFLREHKKVLGSERGNSTGADDVYVPRWVHYDELSFLAEVQRPARKGIDSLDTSSLSVSSRTTENGGVTEDSGQNVENNDGDFRPPPPKVSNKRTSSQKHPIPAPQKLAEMPFARPPDKWEAFGTSVAGDLRSLEDVQQQAIAQKIISDAIFWAKMGRLTELSTVSLEPSTK